MKKVKQFFKNIVWLCNNDLEEKTNPYVKPIKISGDNLISLVTKHRSDKREFEFVDTAKKVTIERI